MKVFSLKITGALDSSLSIQTSMTLLVQKADAIYQVDRVLKTLFQNTYHLGNRCHQQT